MLTICEWCHWYGSHRSCLVEVHHALCATHPDLLQSRSIRFVKWYV